MGKLVNLARMTTATTGTGAITLAAAAVGFITFAAAGVTNGDVVSYGIKDGINSEVGQGTYSSTGPTLTRTVIYKSTNGGAAISLSGTAEVFVIALTEDIDAKLPKSGGTMTGPVTFNNSCHWTYGGSGAGSWYDTNTTVDGFFVGTDNASDAWRIYCAAVGNALSVDRTTGKISVALDPTANLGIATKQYADTKTTVGSSTPAGLGAAAVGSATTAARSDHVHPSQFRDYATSPASADLNTIILQGVYEINTPTNAPSDLGESWCLLQVWRHSNQGNQYLIQLLTTMTLQPVKLYMRSCVGNAPGTWTAWQRITDSNLWGTYTDYFTAANKLIPADQIWNAGLWTTLTDGATVTPDFTYINFNWSLGAAGRTLANPTNITKLGQSGSIYINAGASGTITTWGSYWKFPGGVKPTLTPGGADVLNYVVRTSTLIVCSFLTDVR